MKRKKIVFIVIAAVAAAAVLAGSILFLFLREQPEKPGGEAVGRDELYVRELLSGTKVDDILADPKWKESMVDSTEEYVVVNADYFDFSNKIEITGGYSLLYFDLQTREINMLQHSYVSYADEIGGKALMEDIIGNVQSNITALLGNPSQPFMLLSLEGEQQNTDGMTLDEMIAKTLEGGWVMYALYECDGLRYEMNIMYSDDTAYTTVWVYDEASVCTDEDHEH